MLSLTFIERRRSQDNKLAATTGVQNSPLSHALVLTHSKSYCYSNQKFESACRFKNGGTSDEQLRSSTLQASFSIQSIDSRIGVGAVPLPCLKIAARHAQLGVGVLLIEHRLEPLRPPGRRPGIQVAALPGPAAPSVAAVALPRGRCSCILKLCQSDLSRLLVRPGAVVSTCRVAGFVGRAHASLREGVPHTVRRGGLYIWEGGVVPEIVAAWDVAIARVGLLAILLGGAPVSAEAATLAVATVEGEARAEVHALVKHLSRRSRGDPEAHDL